MSGMTGKPGRSLAPAMQGEQVSHCAFSEWNLPSLSRLSVLRTVVIRALLSWALVPAVVMHIVISTVAVVPDAAATSPAASAAPPAAAGSGGPEVLLAPVMEDLRVLCGCDTLKVDWRGLDRIWRTAERLDSLSIASPLPSSEPERQTDRIVVRLRGLRAGGAVELLLTGDVLCLDSVHVSRRSLRRGGIIGPGDTELVRGWFPPSAAGQERECVEGLHLLNSVSARTPLGRSDLGPAPWVRRGGSLRVVYAAAALHLEVRGVARADGWEGDRIRLRIDGGGRDCEGLVIGPGLVRVLPEGGF